MAVVLDALASYIQNMLKEMGTKEVHKLLGVYGQINNLDIRLKDLKNFLADADRRNIIDQSVQAWVRELRDAMHDAADILDLCQLKAMDQGPMRDAGCFNPLIFCMRNPLHAHNIGNRIKNLNKRLEEIKKRSLDFGFINLGSYEDWNRSVASSRRGSHETSAELDESSLVGEKIEEDMRNLVEMLTKQEVTSHENKKITIFAIVGVGGIGKTTLAQKIFNNDTIQQEFSKKIWLSVNQDISEIELLRRAITEAGGDQQSTGNTKGALERALKEALNGLKTLLVMDDVWSHQPWECVLKTPLVNALGQGSCVLITTRHHMVARGMMAEEPYHNVEKLNDDDAWSLLKMQVVRNKNDEPWIEMLKDIGMKIAKKCDGLPLAVKVIGGLLHQKNTRRSDWENVLHDSIWSMPQMPQELNSAIYLSYQDLHPSLKACFLHYSFLPKGTWFFLHNIIGMWVSEGFIHGTSCDFEKIGREYYDELIQRNLIEPDAQYIDQVVCNMHDVIRSFAQYLARDDALVSHNGEINICDKLKSQKFVRISLEAEGSLSNDIEWSSLQAQRSLRTLISVGQIKIKPGDSLVSFSSLRTLHIEDSDFDELAKSLDQLKHLRYLCVRYSNISRLPENIAKMKFLQCINLAGCKTLVKLPGGIGMLQQLRFLGLHGTSINDIPRGFSCLTNLRQLYGFPVHMDGDRCSLEELELLSKLTDLQIIGLQNVPSSAYAIKARLPEKVHLSFLYLECTGTVGDNGWSIKEEQDISENGEEKIQDVFNQLCPPPCLEQLGIIGYFGRRLPRWMMSTAAVPLGSLRILMMQDLPCCSVLPDGLCQLPSLELLQIERAPVIKRVGHEFLCCADSHMVALFPRLLRLRFRGMLGWEEWHWEEQVKAMPLLEFLELNSCKLSHVPCGLAFHARNLKELCIYDVEHLSSLENLTSIVRLDVFRNKDLERIGFLPKLQKLVIVMCPNIKVLEGMPALQRLNLEDYNMETLPRYLQDINPRHLLLDCSLSLLTCIASAKSGPEWDKFNHIQQLNAYAKYQGARRKCNVVYRRDPFHFKTNISRSAIAQARNQRKELVYMTKCPIEGESVVGRLASTVKHLPLCLRFRWLYSVHLVPWLRQACLHCSEAKRVASPSDQWTEAPAYPACTRIITRT